MVVRFKELPEEVNITLDIHFTNHTITLPLVSDENITLMNGTTHWKRAHPITLFQDTEYQISLGMVQNQSLLVDSVILFPDYLQFKIYDLGNEARRSNITTCWSGRLGMKGGLNEKKQCEQLTFSSMVQWYNMTLGKM